MSNNIKITVEDHEGDKMEMTLDLGITIKDLFLKLETVPAFLGYHPNNICEMWHPDDIQSDGLDDDKE